MTGIMLARHSAKKSGPQVTIRGDGRSNTNLDSPGPVICTNGCDFDTDGDEWENNYLGSQVSQTTWLTSGNASDVWVEFVRTAGATNWDNLTSSVRYQISSDRRYHLQVSTFTTASKTITGYFRMWDAATGGNTLDTGPTATWSVYAEVIGGGGCPFCCFVPGTLVTLASGIQVPIEEVTEKTWLKGTEGDQQVNEVITRYDVPVYTLFFEDGRKLECTPDHPVMTENGPASLTQIEYKDIGVPERLRVGAMVLTDTGEWVRLKKISRPRKEPVVYTFDISEWYAGGILVF